MRLNLNYSFCSDKTTKSRHNYFIIQLQVNSQMCQSTILVSFIKSQNKSRKICILKGNVEGCNLSQMFFAHSMMKMHPNRSKVKPNLKDINATNYIQLQHVYSLKSSKDSLSAAARSFPTVCMDTITSNIFVLCT